MPSHRYRPASEYDDATLAQKREYWRTKKREQRARLTDQRGTLKQGKQGENPQLLSSVSWAASSSSWQNHNVSHVQQSGNAGGNDSGKSALSQKEKQLQTRKLMRVSPQLPASSSVSAKVAGDNNATVKWLPAGGAVSRSVTSIKPSGTQFNTTSSVPPVRVTRMTITNGSSTKAASQPCLSMQGASVSKAQLKAQVALCIQPKPLSPRVTTNAIRVSSPCSPVHIKTEGKEANTTPQTGTKSALITTLAKGPPESEEERAAKRREQWRIKKREQRAKLAARLKGRERTQGGEGKPQRQTAQTARCVEGTVLPSQFLRRAGQRRCLPRIRPSFSFSRRENDKLQTGAARLTTAKLNLDQQAAQMKMQKPQGDRMTLTAITHGAKKTAEPTRRLPAFSYLSYTTRGIGRCRTPRQRFIEAQKSFLSQRIMRGKSLSPAAVFFSSRNAPKIDPNDTPEQIIAKRREYWRVKKREQRAKLSMEVKARLKEKDSLMRRVKRYQKILEDMRRARAEACSSLSHASETIGGFIKEDGTVTNNIPHVPTACKSDEVHVGLNNNLITQPQPPLYSKHKGRVTLKVNQPPPLLRPAHVKVSFPLAVNLVSKPQKLLMVAPTTQLESTTTAVTDSQTQLTLTHPHAPENAATRGSKPGGCIMKMAVSSCAPLTSTAPVDAELTEEERMAKKREYWRVKKREQRAARAARLKHSVLQARANAAFHRRKIHKLTSAQQSASGTVPMSRNRTNSEYTQTQISVANTIEIKKEIEFAPVLDLNPQSEQAICPEINPSAPPPPPQLEPDPALSADSQSTTLLAVASMKKLLEESLSSVTECKTEPGSFKTEADESPPEQEMKQNLPQPEDVINSVAPVTSDESPSAHLKDSSQISKTLLPASEETCPHSISESSSQTPPHVTISPSTKAPDSPAPASPRRTKRVRASKLAHQHCCTPEPPKLHHPPSDQQRQHSEQQHPAQDDNNPESAQKQFHSAVTVDGSMNSLQRKREYWKMMKRQQRARLKARVNRLGECSRRIYPKNIQAPNIISGALKGVKAAVSALTAVTSIPTLLVVSPTTSSAGQSLDTLQVKPAITSVSCSPNQEPPGPSQIVSDSVGDYSIVSLLGNGMDNMQALVDDEQATASPQKWMSEVSDSTDVDSAPSLPSLEPPDNPLTSITLQPTELSRAPNSTQSPSKIPDAQSPTSQHLLPPPIKLTPISTMVPPKPIPGESEEDFMKRKREYWRIKKKEQRARKAIQDKELTQRSTSNYWRPALPVQGTQALQDSSRWEKSSDESEPLMSATLDADLTSFPFPAYTVPLEGESSRFGTDESELGFTDYEHNNGEDDPVSDLVWRNHYLMDYDPLNQLLVCMVCGELQYSHSLEGVRAHIDEAHPDTLNLEARERQRILESWDEQVSQRERFFISQLQQHSEALTESHRN
ncbi:uncharacterized protein LOC143000957 isoform X2 [Genypterus blacodes]|uniref:uncharacterized protein LOC143000957 isoform X2 n=1 Tax=Genypterus blacodes TaxID=154954 RepID=UPI003F75ED91